jgi:hypothetical protein
VFKIELVSDSADEKLFESVSKSIQDALNEHRFEHEVTANITTTGLFDPTAGVSLSTSNQYI